MFYGKGFLIFAAFLCVSNLAHSKVLEWFEGAADLDKISSWTAEEKLAIKAVHVNNCELSRNEILFLSQCLNVRSLTLGESPEGVTVQNGCLQLLSTLTKIEQLSICISGMNEEEIKFIENFPNISALSVTRQFPDRIVLSDEFGQTLAKLKKLESLSLCGFGGYSDNFLNDLPPILRLSIQSCNIDDRFLNQLSTVETLVDVFISSKRITEKGIISLTNNTGIESISISAPFIAEKALDRLLGMPNLRTLYITGLSISGKSLKILKSHMSKKVYLRGILVSYSLLTLLDEALAADK